MGSKNAVLGGIAFAAVAALAWPAGEARGAIVVDARESVVDVATVAESSFGGTPAMDDDTRSTSSKTDPFSQRVMATSEAFGVLAEAEAGQSSSLTIVGGSLTGASANGDSFVQTVASSENDFADANSSSEFLLQFTVPAGESYNYVLTGTLTDNSFRTGAQVYLYDVARDVDLLFRSGDAGAFNSNGQLQPGQYELFASSFGLATEVSPGGGDASYTVELALSPVPEPASLALAAMLGVPFGARRRRRTR